MTTKDKIYKAAAQLLAKAGYEGVHMRSLAKASGIVPSVLYHHFKDKDTMLLEMTQNITRELDQERMLLEQPRTASAMLRDRILFHFEHAEQIMMLLKYYLACREKMRKTNVGWLPESMYAHLTDVIVFGLKTGEFKSKDIKKDAKKMYYFITGYLLEIYPKIPTGKEKESLVREIQTYLLETIKNQAQKPSHTLKKK